MRHPHPHHPSKRASVGVLDATPALAPNTRRWGFRHPRPRPLSQRDTLTPTPALAPNARWGSRRRPCPRSKRESSRRLPSLQTRDGGVFDTHTLALSLDVTPSPPPS